MQSGTMDDWVFLEDLEAVMLYFEKPYTEEERQEQDNRERMLRESEMARVAKVLQRVKQFGKNSKGAISIDALQQAAAEEAVAESSSEGPRFARCLNTYVPDRINKETHLEFAAGEIFSVLDYRNDATYWSAQRYGQKGLVPRTFMQLLPSDYVFQEQDKDVSRPGTAAEEEAAAASLLEKVEEMKQVFPEGQVVALDTFSATMAEELSFKAGEKLELIPCHPYHDAEHWYRAKLNGKIGDIPKKCVTTESDTVKPHDQEPDAKAQSKPDATN